MISRLKPPKGVLLNQSHPLSKGLIGCWTINEGGGNAIFDFSGNGKKGTLVGADWVPDGLEFVVANTDWVATSSFIVPTVFTVFCVCRNDYIGAEEHLVVSAWDGINRIHLGLLPDQNQVYVCHSNASYERYDFTGFYDGNFHSHCVTWDGSAYKYYFDLNLKSVAASGNPSDTDQSVLLIGARATGAGYDRYFDGVIKMVYIYNRPLIFSEISLLDREPYQMFEAEFPWEYVAYGAAGVTLVVAALDGAGSLDGVSLTQKHNITVQESLSSGALDGITLNQKHTLAIQALLSSGLLDNIVLTQKHLLVLQDLLSSGTLDNVILAQKHLLAIQGMSGSGAIDNVALTQKHLLAVQELLSSGALDSKALTQKHLLAVNSLLSSGAIDNIVFILSTLLVVSDLISTGAIDTTSLTQKHTLTVQEVLSEGTLDNVSLTQKQLLIINSLLSSGIIDNITFAIEDGLICITLSEATEFNITTTKSTEYNITTGQETEYNIVLSKSGGGICNG